MTTTYRGVVRDNHIELREAANLPEGLEVEVLVPDVPESSDAPAGSVAALLHVIESPPMCSTEDVDALTSAIHEGRRATRFEGPFDAHSAA